MKIEIYTDIHCPYCYLGKYKLKKGLEAFEGGKNLGKGKGALGCGW